MDRVKQMVTFSIVINILQWYTCITEWITLKKANVALLKLVQQVTTGTVFYQKTYQMTFINNAIFWQIAYLMNNYETL